MNPSAGIRSASVLALLALVLLLYAPLSGHAFVDYDTEIYLTGNAWVREGLSWEGLVWAFDGFHAANYHPLTWLSHMLDVELFGLEPAGHLLHNAVLHGLNACLVAALLRALGLGDGLAWCCALGFAAHPLRVEPVAWIAERKDLLASLLGFAALLVWVRARRLGTAAGQWLAVLLLGLSLLSKPMFVTLPCIWLLLEIWPLHPQSRARASWRPKPADLPLLAGFALSALFCGLTVLAQSQFGALQCIGARPPLERLAIALDAYRWYLAKQFWPTDLAFHYPAPQWTLTGSLLRAGLLASLLWMLWRVRVESPWITLGGLWFLGTLVPVIGLVQVGAQPWADRFSYLPSVGLCVALGFSVERWGLHRRVWLRAGFVVLVCAAFAATRAQLETWRDTESMARQALRVTQDNAPAHIQLGIALAERGSVAEALPELERAFALEPGNPDACLNLGALRLRQGDLAGGRALLERAVDLVPMRALAWSHLGAAQLLAGELSTALESLDEALRLEPRLASAHANRAGVLEGLQRLEEACEEYKQALRLKPESESARAGLARCHLRRADAAQARGEHSTALQELGRAEELAGTRGKLLQEIARRRKEWMP